MKIYEITDREFAEYGKVIDSDYSEILSILKEKECPEHVIYVPSDSEMEKTAEAKWIQREVYGGMDIQIGYCNGHNQLLNCVEYHKGSELDIAETDTILLLGKLQEVTDGQYDTNKIKAFLVPAGKGVELYATTLHYAPCGVKGSGFRVVIVLPNGTNREKPAGAADKMLWGSNKWLIAHPESNEAKQGAYVGLVGENIRI